MGLALLAGDGRRFAAVVYRVPESATVAPAGGTSA
jgi:hypothetical protein